MFVKKCTMIVGLKAKKARQFSREPHARFFSRARRRLVRGVEGAGTRLSCRQSGRRGTLINVFAEGCFSCVTTAIFVLKFQKAFTKAPHPAPPPRLKNASAVKDEQRGGYGREPRPH